MISFKTPWCNFGHDHFWPCNMNISASRKLTKVLYFIVCFFVSLKSQNIYKKVELRITWFDFWLDYRCSVCLGDYQANEKLQQIPPCGNTFHMDCIDLWLTSHTTCPLCRLSIIPKSSLDRSQQNPETVSSISNSDGGGASAQPESQSVGEIVSHIDDGQEGDNDCT